MSYCSLADLTDVTLVREVAAQNSLQMSSSRDSTDVTLVSEDESCLSKQTKVVFW